MLINYISEPMRKIVGGFKDKVVSLFLKKHLNRTCIGPERNYANRKHKKNLKKTKLISLEIPLY